MQGSGGGLHNVGEYQLVRSVRGRRWQAVCSTTTERTSGERVSDKGWQALHST